MTALRSCWATDPERMLSNDYLTAIVVLDEGKSVFPQILVIP